MNKFTDIKLNNGYISFHCIQLFVLRGLNSGSRVYRSR